MPHRLNAHGARQTLLVAAAMVLLGEILAGFLVDRVPVDIRFPDAAAIIARARARDRSPDVVFLGTSRTQNQIKAAVVERELARGAATRPPWVLNAGVHYGEPIVAEFIAARLFDAGIRPEIVVIEVSPETTSRRLVSMDAHLARMLTWPDIVAALPNVYYSHSISDLLSTRLIPIFTFRHEFREWLRRAPGLRVVGLCCGATRSEPTVREVETRRVPTTHDALVAQALTMRRRLRDYQVSGIAPEALERLVARSASLGATVVLFGTAISSPSRAEYLPAIDAEYLAFVRKLAEAHGAHFVDYRDRVPDQHFWAAYYTTEQGSRSVSRLLVRDVIGPLWQARIGDAARR